MTTLSRSISCVRSVQSIHTFINMGQNTQWSKMWGGSLFYPHIHNLKLSRVFSLSKEIINIIHTYISTYIHTYTHSRHSFMQESDLAVQSYSTELRAWGTLKLYPDSLGVYNSLLGAWLTCGALAHGTTPSHPLPGDSRPPVYSFLISPPEPFIPHLSRHD